MLVIRDEQLRLFQESRRQRFEDEMVDHLSKRFAGRAIAGDRERLRTFVRRGITSAAGYGFTVAFDVRCFLELSAELGENFHRLPWATRILTDSTLSICGKMEQLDQCSLFARHA